MKNLKGSGIFCAVKENPWKVTLIIKNFKVCLFLHRNPVMRTGLKGRGILGRYGPNHTTTAVFTR